MKPLLLLLLLTGCGIFEPEERVPSCYTLIVPAPGTKLNVDSIVAATHPDSLSLIVSDTLIAVRGPQENCGR